MSFIFSLSNVGAYWLKKQLVQQGTPCVYILYGESGSGKSLFLKDFAYERTDTVVLKCEELMDLMTEAIKKSVIIDNVVPFPLGARFVILDNMEGIKSNGFLIYFSQWVNAICNHGKTVIVSDCSNIPINLKINGQVKYVRFKKTRTTRIIIKKMAKENNKDLDEITMEQLLLRYKYVNGLEKEIMRL